MKKIPTVFERQYENHKVVGITDKFTNEECMEAFLFGDATIKIDGSCCAIINGEFYKRYDAKKGKKAPVGAIPCCEADPITGHHPHWVKVDENNPADKWFIEAKNNSYTLLPLTNGTYEAIGKHFQGNPYKLEIDILKKHGNEHPSCNIERTFEGVKRYLTENYVEGLVFWYMGHPVCKIKRTDFGLKWNGRGQR